MDYATFTADEWTIDAVLLNLSIIGEAASRVPNDVRLAHPEVPWREMQDTRNFIVHDYFKIDPAIIWRTLCEDLPQMLMALDEAFGSE